MFDKIGIVGIGLIGGSLAKAIKRADSSVEIVAIDCNEAFLSAALREGTADRADTDFNALVGCKLIVVCTGAERVVEDINNAHLAERDALISDVCSVKDFLSSINSDARYIGGHPMAGTEKSGYGNSQQNLFEGRRYIITEGTERAERSGGRQELKEFILDIGAIPVEMSCSRHDSILASVSHLPHIAAYLLADAGLSCREAFMLSGGGFKDTTRIASSSPEMWTEIFAANKQNVLAAAREYKQRLNEFINELEKGDKQAVQEILKKGKEKRDKLC